MHFDLASGQWAGTMWGRIKVIAPVGQTQQATQMVEIQGAPPSATEGGDGFKATLAASLGGGATKDSPAATDASGGTKQGAVNPSAGKQAGSGIVVLRELASRTAAGITAKAVLAASAKRASDALATEATQTRDEDTDNAVALLSKAVGVSEDAVASAEKSASAKLVDGKASNAVADVTVPGATAQAASESSDLKAAVEAPKVLPADTAQPAGNGTIASVPAEKKVQAAQVQAATSLQAASVAPDATAAASATAAQNLLVASVQPGPLARIDALRAEEASSDEAASTLRKAPSASGVTSGSRPNIDAVQRLQSDVAGAKSSVTGAPAVASASVTAGIAGSVPGKSDDSFGAAIEAQAEAQTVSSVAQTHGQTIPEAQTTTAARGKIVAVQAGTATVNVRVAEAAVPVESSAVLASDATGARQALAGTGDSAAAYLKVVNTDGSADGRTVSAIATPALANIAAGADAAAGLKSAVQSHVGAASAPVAAADSAALSAAQRASSAVAAPAQNSGAKQAQSLPEVAAGPSLHDAVTVKPQTAAVGSNAAQGVALKTAAANNQGASSSAANSAEKAETATQTTAASNVPVAEAQAAVQQAVIVAANRTGVQVANGLTVAAANANTAASSRAGVVKSVDDAKRAQAGIAEAQDAVSDATTATAATPAAGHANANTDWSAAAAVTATPGATSAASVSTVAGAATTVPAIATGVLHAGGVHGGLAAQLTDGVTTSVEKVAGGDAAGPIGETHRTLESTASTLEVGVQSGTQGWLKIRAEVGGQGEVTASLAAASSSGQEMLRGQMPALNAYLHSEQMAVTATVASHGFGSAAGGGTAPDAGGSYRPDSSAQSSSSLGSGLQGGEAQGDGRPAESASQQATGVEVGGTVRSYDQSYDKSGGLSDAVLSQAVTAGESGRWLNVRA